jgi:hypothetical protein
MGAVQIAVWGPDHAAERAGHPSARDLVVRTVLISGEPGPVTRMHTRCGTTGTLPSRLEITALSIN